MLQRLHSVAYLLLFLLLAPAGAQANEIPAAAPMTDFSVDIKNQQVTLSWKTIYASDYRAFVIQRSLDGHKWEPAGRIELTHASPFSPPEYAFQEEFIKDRPYYRVLLEYSNDDVQILVVKKVLSDIANLYVEGNLDVEKQILALHYVTNNYSPLMIRIYNIIGREIDNQAIPSGEPGEYHLKLDFSKYKPGIYLLVFNQFDKDVDLTNIRIENIAEATYKNFMFAYKNFIQLK